MKTRRAGNKVRITIYFIAGNHNFFIIPEKVCEECDLAIRIVRSTIKTLGSDKFDLRIKSWIWHLVPSLLKGGWHPPVVVVDGEIFSQGKIPDKQKLMDKLASIAV